MENVVEQASMNKKAAKYELRKMLFEKALRVGVEDEFILASGRKSKYYIDCKKVMLDAKGLNLIAWCMWDFIALNLDKNPRVELVGGMLLGAALIALPVSLEAWRVGNRYINPILVRKTAKDHGTKQSIEGIFTPGDYVVVVDDVFTTGESTLKAIEAFQEAGLKIIEAIALVDREEGAAETFAKAGIEHRALFTIKNLMGE